MSTFWDVILKARILQFYAATKHPSDEAVYYFERAEGMLEGLRTVFGVDFCNEIEEAVTVRFAVKRGGKWKPEDFDSQVIEGRTKLGYLAVEVQELAQEYAQNFDVVRKTMLQNIGKAREALGETKKSEGIPKGLITKIPPQENN